jgi:hypothetical protein
MTEPRETNDVPAARGLGTLDRISSLRFIYVVIFLFIIVYVYSLRGAEFLLHIHFQNELARVVQVDPLQGSVSAQIEQNIDHLLSSSKLVRWGGVRVEPMVQASDGATLLYLGGQAFAPRPPPVIPPLAPWDESQLLPAVSMVRITLPHNTVLANSILLFWGAVLLWIIFNYNRALLRAEHDALERALSERNATAARATEIESELAQVQGSLDDAEDLFLAQEEEAQSRVDAASSEERTRRERLEAEQRELEEMLDEALSDLSRKDEQIHGLKANVKKSERSSGKRTRGSDLMARRLRTLYKDIEFDDRAIESMLDLGDEHMKLRAEEIIKRLAEEPEAASVRRKLSGLPLHLSIFELGFAGKGRIYYAKGTQRRHRILLIGAKNSQKADLDYLSKLSL